MKLTQAEAARAAGVSRTHILRAIKSGKLSAEKLENGGVRIDASELLRLWPKANLEQARNSGNSHGNSQGDTGNSAFTGAAQALLEQITKERDRLLEELKEERRERQQLVRTIEEQAVAVRSQGEQIKLLTDQRERRHWWQFWK